MYKLLNSSVFVGIRRYSPILLLILFYQIGLFAQPTHDFDCATDYIPISQGFPSGSPDCDETDFTETDIFLLPEVIINVQFHFIGDPNPLVTDPNDIIPDMPLNFSPDSRDGNLFNGLLYSAGVLVEVNRRLGEEGLWHPDPIPPTPGFLVNPASVASSLVSGIQHSFIGDSRIRVRRYSEGLGDTDGVWFWTDRTDFDDNFTDDVIDGAYEYKVLHIIVENRLNPNPPLPGEDVDPCSRWGKWLGGSCETSNPAMIGMYNILNTNRNMATLPPPIPDWGDCISHSYDYSRLLLHELGHAGGLNHTFSFPNECSACPNALGGMGQDIDINLECNGNGTCTNLGSCNEWDGLSNNIMNYAKRKSGLSPCQWKIIYNNFYNECYTEIGETVCDYIESTDTLKIYDKERIVWETERFNNRPVIIKPGGKLTIKCKIHNSKEAYYEVERGGMLEIDGGVLSNLCSSELWRGVYVQGTKGITHPRILGSLVKTGYLTPTGPGGYFGIAKLINGGCIEYANTGIRTKARSGYRPGGLVQSIGGIFRNNKRAVEILGYPVSASTMGIFNNSSFFKDTEFKKDDDSALISEPGCGNYGVTMWQVHGALFANCEFNDLNLIGILSGNSGYDVADGCKFKSIPIGINAAWASPGLAPYNFNILRSYQVAVALGGRFPHEFQHRRNEFEGCTIGIQGASQFLHVDHADFNGNGIGIKLIGLSEFVIQKNIFDCNGTAVDLESTGAVSPLDNTIPINPIQCNNYKKGIGIKIFGNNPLARIFREDFNTNLDIQLLPSGNTASKTNFFDEALDPFFNDDLPSNKFTTTGQRIVSPTDTQSKKEIAYFIYRHPTDKTTYPRYFPECDETNQSCPNNYKNSSVNQPPLSECDLAKPQPRIFYPGCSGIDCFQNYSLLLQNAIADAGEVQSDEEFRAIQQLKLNRNFLRDSMIVHWLETEDFISIENLLVNSGIDEDLRSLINIKIGLGQYEAANNVIDNYSGEDVFTSDYFAIQKIYLNWLQTGIFGSNSLNILLPIITKKSQNSGYAVGVYNLIADEPYLDDNESELPCFNGGADEETENGRIKNKTQNLISLKSLMPVPNPTSDGFTLNFETEISGDFYLFNSLGQLLQNEKILKANIFTFNSQALPAGIYHIKIKHNTGLTQSGKVLIQH